MKQLNIFAAVLALTCFAFFPATVRAGDALEDLDVTMIVVDDSGELESSVLEMPGPDDGDVRDDDWEDDVRDDESEEDERDDDFDFEDEEEGDDDFDHDNEEEDELEEEDDDLDDGDEVDDDLDDEEEEDEMDDDDSELGDDSVEGEND